MSLKELIKVIEDLEEEKDSIWKKYNTTEDIKLNDRYDGSQAIAFLSKGNYQPYINIVNKYLNKYRHKKKRFSYTKSKPYEKNMLLLKYYLAKYTEKELYKKLNAKDRPKIKMTSTEFNNKNCIKPLLRQEILYEPNIKIQERFYNYANPFSDYSKGEEFTKAHLPKNIDYTGHDKHLHYWVDFANKNLGGGALSPHGFVQEEIMTYLMIQFLDILADKVISQPETPLYKIPNFGSIILENLIVTGQVTHDCSKNMEKGKSFYGSSVTKFLKDKFYISTDPKNESEEYEYDEAFDKILYKRKDDEIIYGHVIAIDADRYYDYNKKESIDNYNVSELRRIFLKAFSAFYHVKQKNKNKIINIHTGAWGCGAFNNHLPTMLAVQYLAAKYAKIDQIHFWVITKEEDRNIENIKDNAMKIREKILNN